MTLGLSRSMRTCSVPGRHINSTEIHLPAYGLITLLSASDFGPNSFWDGRRIRERLSILGITTIFFTTDITRTAADPSLDSFETVDPSSLRSLTSSSEVFDARIRCFDNMQPHGKLCGCNIYDRWTQALLQIFSSSNVFYSLISRFVRYLTDTPISRDNLDANYFYRN
jgi:hypothetical protein